MGSALNSIDDLLNQWSVKGGLPRLIGCRIAAATTAATTTSGLTTGQRFPQTFALPTLGAGVTGAYCLLCDLIQQTANVHMLAAIEYLLGTLTLSTNSFAAGVAMPSKLVRGSTLTTAALLTLLAVNTTLTATTPVITITYTDQAGNTGQTATLTLPTNALVTSAFVVTPHLANADTGIRAVTNMSRDVGTAGVLNIYGLLPIGYGSIGGNVGLGGCIEPMTQMNVLWPLNSGDVIGFYRFGTTATGEMLTALALVADN